MQDKINYVVDFIIDPCDAPLQIYVQTFWPALLKALMTYYALDLVQAFTGYVRPNQLPKNMRGMSHRRGAKQRGKPRTWLRYWRRISSFDPGEEAGRALPGAKEVGSRSTSLGVMHLWSVYGILERFAWWFMVIAITVDFFYDWASGVMASEYCRQQRRPWAMGRSIHVTTSAILDRWPVVIQEVLKERNGASVSGNGGGCPAPGGIAIMSCERVPNNPGQIEAQSAVPVLIINGTRHAGTQNDPTNPNKWQVAFRNSEALTANMYVENDAFFSSWNVELTIIGNVRDPRPT